jgi:hypothetical protein
MQGDQDMSDSTIPAEKPVNDGGGGNAPQAGSPTEEAPAETQETQEAGQ